MRNARIGMAGVALCAVMTALTGCPPTGGPGNGNRNANGAANTNGNANANVNENANGNENGNGAPSAENGRVIYTAQRCINCHGFDGRGSPQFPGAPVVIGRTAEDVRSQVVNDPDCVDPLSLSCHPLQIPTMNDAQLVDLEAYLAVLAESGSVEDPGPPCDVTPGNICTIAGNGVSGSRRGAGILARRQNLFWPQNVTLDPQGRVVITDWNNYVIRRIENECQPVTDDQGNPAGTDCVITNIIGTGGLGDSCSTMASPIQAVDATMNHPVGVLYDDLGNIILWGWHQWKIKYIPVDANGSTGEMFCLFGNGRGVGAENIQAGFGVTTMVDGMAQMTRFNLPSSCVYDNAGNFYISDQGNLRLRIVEADGDDDDSSATAFVQSRLNNNVRTFAGGLRDSAGNFRRTLADYSDSGDGGPASMCTFNVQAGFDAIPQLRMVLDRDRNLLYVADSENNRVRVIDLATEIITTFAGGGTDVEGDNVPATQVELNAPADVDLQPGTGNLLITDTFNHCVRLVDINTGMIRTVAGICGPPPADGVYYSGDGGPATEARLQEPGGAYIAADGTVYIADTLNHRVRRVNP